MGMISDLYNGTVTPFENIGYPDCDDYKDVVGEIERLENLLLDKLDEEQKGLYTMVISLRSTREIMELERTFVDGFKIAALLVIDVYSDNE